MVQLSEKKFGHFRPSRGSDLLLWFSRNSFLGRGFARRLLAKSILNNQNQPFDVTLWGGQARLYPHENVSEKKALLCPGHYDHKELQFLSDHLQNKGAVFLDIGANAGLYSFSIAMRAKASINIHMFEPEPEMMRRIKEKFSLNDNQPQLQKHQIFYHNFALGSEDTTGVLVRGANDFGGAHIEGNLLSNRQLNEEKQNKQDISIKDITKLIDELQLTSIDGLKIDVEGYEDKIIKPIFEQMNSSLWPKALLIEHISKDDWDYDCIGEAVRRGYRQAFQTRNNTALLRK